MSKTTRNKIFLFGIIFSIIFLFDCLSVTAYFPQDIENQAQFIPNIVGSDSKLLSSGETNILKSRNFRFKGSLPDLKSGDIVQVWKDGRLVKNIKLGNRRSWKYRPRHRRNTISTYRFFYYDGVTKENIATTPDYAVFLDKLSPKFTYFPKSINAAAGSFVTWLATDNDRISSYQIIFQGRKTSVAEASFQVPRSANLKNSRMTVTVIDRAGNRTTKKMRVRVQSPLAEENDVASVVSYTLAYASGSHGTITGSASQTVTSGSDGSSVTAVPDTGYHFVSWSDGVMTATRTDTNITADKSVTASFEADASSSYTLTYAAGSGGIITGDSPQTVSSGENGSEVTAIPDTGRHFVQWSDNIMTATRTDEDVSGDISVTAEFAINTYTLAYVAGTGGTISGDSSQTVNFGANGSAVTAVPDSGYHFVEWSDHVSTEERTDLSITANLSVSAVFATNSIVTVTAIDPTSGYNTDSVDLTSITGTGFLTGATVKLTKSGESDVPCTGFTVASSTSITGGACHITSVEAGTWNVVVTNPDTGSGTLTNGFTVQEYIIGSTGPAGGLIFYINENYETDGWKYLEAAPSSGDVTTIRWSGIEVLMGTTGEDIGDGKDNTTAIIAQNGFTTGAAKNCDDFTVNGYSDWFLPSREELNEMYNTIRNSGNFSLVSPASYWSSSESADTTAYRKKFDSGISDAVDKGGTYKYRPVRRFSTTVTYDITYDGNGNTEGTVPTDANHYPSGSEVVILDEGDLVKDGHKFMGWNTSADGNGTTYEDEDILTIGSSDVTLYAIWEVDFYVTIFPDTQSSVNWKHSVLTNQIDWIINNKNILDIRFVGHVGDLVQEWDQDLTEWTFIQDEMGQLGTAGIPYATLPGNHDYAQNTRNSTMLNSYFPLSTFSGMPTYSGAYDSNSDNTYHILNIGGKKLLIMSLEFGPRDAVVAWANGILQAEANRDTKAIIITHAYINTDGNLLASGMEHAASNGYGLGSDVNDGDELWTDLIEPNNNVAFVICGHDGTSTDGSGKKESNHSANGAPVHQFLTNYQYYSPVDNGSYFFLLHFTEDKVEVRTFSSYLNQYKTDAESQADYNDWSF